MCHREEEAVNSSKDVFVKKQLVADEAEDSRFPRRSARSGFRGVISHNSLPLVINLMHACIGLIMISINDSAVTSCCVESQIRLYVIYTEQQMSQDNFT